MSTRQKRRIERKRRFTKIPTAECNNSTSHCYKPAIWGIIWNDGKVRHYCHQHQPGLKLTKEDACLSFPWKREGSPKADNWILQIITPVGTILFQRRVDTPFGA